MVRCWHMAICPRSKIHGSIEFRRQVCDQKHEARCKSRRRDPWRQDRAVIQDRVNWEGNHWCCVRWSNGKVTWTSSSKRELRPCSSASLHWVELEVPGTSVEEVQGGIQAPSTGGTTRRLHTGGNGSQERRGDLTQDPVTVDCPADAVVETKLIKLQQQDEMLNQQHWRLVSEKEWMKNLLIGIANHVGYPLPKRSKDYNPDEFTQDPEDSF